MEAVNDEPGIGVGTIPVSFRSLFIEMRFNGQAVANGTAFVVQSGKGPVLVTARHNVTGRDHYTGELLSKKTAAEPNEIAIFHHKAGPRGYWTECVEELLSGGAPRWIEHPTLKERADFVALPLLNTGNLQFYYYDPANPGADILWGPADPVSVIGFPFGITAGFGHVPVWATGFVASEPGFNYSEQPVFLIDCRSRKGQSGAPVVAYRSSGAIPASGNTIMYVVPAHRFLGIYSARVNKDSDLGMVWKATAVQELIASI